MIVGHACAVGNMECLGVGCAPPHFEAGAKFRKADSNLGLTVCARIRRFGNGAWP